MKINEGVLTILVMTLVIAACGGGDSDYFPKPRTYPRVYYPEKTYQSFSTNYCDFGFEQATYAQIIQDTSFFGEKPIHPCWFDMVVPQLNSKLHCSYIPIDNKENTLLELVNDSYDLAFKHTSKASGIGEEAIFFPDKKVYGILFPLEGSVASPYQFFLTDSTQHFFRGSLYFNSEPRPDSLKPVIEFMKQDIDKLIETFEWK
jgi:gliding motility-associated lipoprotein GldD